MVVGDRGVVCQASIGQDQKSSGANQAGRAQAQPAQPPGERGKSPTTPGERRLRWGNEDLEVKNRLIHAKGESKPYTGITFETFKSGKVKSEFHYVDGKKNGLGVIYYENGRKAHEANSVNGVVVGTEIEWWENGRKRKETVWHKGANGRRSVTQWRENGELFQKFEMQNAPGAAKK
jgi:antitoxin component YwqK of YwqJK toxin-antitoxin module